MFSRVLLVFVAILLIQNTNCLSRSEIQSQYKPTLDRLRALASTKYQEATKQYSALTNQINQQQTHAKNSTQTNINKIKSAITSFKKRPNITSTELSCVVAQENLANRLSTSSMNNCFTSSNTSALVNSKAKFTSLSNVALNTVQWCTNLNPLPTQDEPFTKCLAEMIPNLNRQINIVQNEYNDLSNGTLHLNIKCLADQAGAIFDQVGHISYQTNLCFF